MTPETRRREPTTLRVLCWYGLGASTRSTVWAGFRRATITAAGLTLLSMIFVGQLAGGSEQGSWMRSGDELFYVVPVTWAAFVAVVTLPGVYRLLRRQHRAT